MVDEHDGMIEAILRGIGVLMTDRWTFAILDSLLPLKYHKMYSIMSF